MPDPLKYLDAAVKIAAAKEIVPLQDALLKGRQEALELQDEVERLRRENADLRAKSGLAGELVRREGVLWLDGASDPGPYCTACWDIKQARIRINLSEAGAICPACNQGYDVSDETRAKHGFPKVGVPDVKFFGLRVTPDQF